MNNTSIYDKNSQLEILNLTIKRPNSTEIIDIYPIMDQFIIYEDMFQTSISAKLVFRDQLNLVGTLPIIGGETINIKYRTPIYTDAIELNFVVYEIGDRGISNSSENIQINQLMLCTPEVWWAANNDISTAFRGSYTDIINKLLSGTGTKKLFTKEDSIGIVNFVSPSVWNVFKAIRFCAGRANSKTLSPMFFWETAHGYSLRSLKEIYRDAQYKFLYIEDRSVFGADDNADKVFNTVYSFEYLSSNNRLQQYTDSAFGGDFYSVDFTNKRIFRNNYSYDDVFNRQDIKLNKYPLNDDAKSIRNRDDYMSYRSDLSHIGQFNRISNLSLMDNFKILVNIPGDSQMRAGDVVWMDVPSRSGTDISSEEFSSGKWLVRSLKHLITKNTYSQICELTKDAFDANTNNGG